MKIKRQFAIGISIALLVFAHAFSFAADDPGTEQLSNAPDRGEIQWNDWTFRYSIGTGALEGLVIENVKFKNKSVLRKASMPVVRVKYKGNEVAASSGCGPYADKFYTSSVIGFLDLGHFKTIYPFPGKTGASNVITFQRATDRNEKLFGIYVYGEIGGYRLWHGWNFSSDGKLEPMLYSSGWSCDDGVVKNDHRHHPYWRFEFNLGETRNDIWAARSTPGQNTTLSKITTEQDLSRGPNEDLAFVVAKSDSDQHALVRILKSDNDEIDGPAKPWFGFSRIDAAVRLYKAEEDRGWQFGSTGELGYADIFEPIENQFNVLWLVRHLSHRYIVGGDDEAHNHWHGTGIRIELVNW